MREVELGIVVSTGPGTDTSCGHLTRAGWGLWSETPSGHLTTHTSPLSAHTIWL